MSLQLWGSWLTCFLSIFLTGHPLKGSFSFLAYWCAESFMLCPAIIYADKISFCFFTFSWPLPTNTSPSNVWLEVIVGQEISRMGKERVCESLWFPAPSQPRYLPPGSQSYQLQSPGWYSWKWCSIGHPCRNKHSYISSLITVTDQTRSHHCLPFLISLVALEKVLAEGLLKDQCPTSPYKCTYSAQQ